MTLHFFKLGTRAKYLTLKVIAYDYQKFIKQVGMARESSEPYVSMHRLYSWKCHRLYNLFGNVSPPSQNYRNAR